MKLINTEGKLGMFEVEIVVDKALPKYSKIIEAKEKKLKDTAKALKESDPDAELEMKDPTTPLEFEMTISGAREKVVSGVTEISDIKSYVSKEDATLFNLQISEYLFQRLNSSLEFGFFNRAIAANDQSIVTVNNVIPEKDGGTKKEGLVKKFTRVLKDSWKKKEEKPEEESIYELDVLDLFDAIKVKVGEEKEFVERVGAYLKLIKKAQALHQKAQEEELVSELILHIYESILAVNGFRRYLTAEDLVELQKKCSRALDIDYIANFVRVIPDEVVEKKLEADRLEVFDNYVVLYYDPTGKSFAKTEEEKKKEEQRKRDPILFGVIRGSRRLYYISDWVDELCDLTWDKVIEKINERPEL